MARWRCWGATCGYQAKNPVALVVIEDLDKYNYGTMGITMGITMGESFVGYFAIYKWDINILLVVWNMNFIFPIQLGMSSSQLTFIFFRGVAQPPSSFCSLCHV
jgi:hypothetical protein